MCECVAMRASREAPEVEPSIVTGPPPGTAAADTFAVAMLVNECLRLCPLCLLCVWNSDETGDKNRGGDERPVNVSLSAGCDGCDADGGRG